MKPQFKLLSAAVCIAITSSAYGTAIQNNEVQTLQQQINQIQQQINRLSHRGQSPIPTNSIFFDGKDNSAKFEEMSSTNLPLSVLQLKSTYPNQSVVIGGMLEMETQYWWGSSFASNSSPTAGTVAGPNDDYHYHSGSGISVSSANLDAMANINQWAQTFVQLHASDTSSMSLESGFINIGNLAQSPFFLTLGKNRMRFGNFPGAPWAASIPQGIVRPGHVNTLTVGYNKDHLNFNLAMYNVPKGNKEAFMASAFYDNAFNQSWSYEINTGLVSNVRGLGNAFDSALASAGPDQESTPGFNVESKLSYKQLSASGGFFTTLKDTNVTNHKKAGTWYAQLAYTQKLFDQDVLFAINYSGAYHTENVAMPLAGDANHGPSLYGVQKEIFTYADTEIGHSINVGLEYAWMQTYNSQHTNEITLYTAYYF